MANVFASNRHLVASVDDWLELSGYIFTKYLTKISSIRLGGWVKVSNTDVLFDVLCHYFVGKAATENYQSAFYPRKMMHVLHLGAIFKSFQFSFTFEDRHRPSLGAVGQSSLILVTFFTSDNRSLISKFKK
jgi:hypothetical protein